MAIISKRGKKEVAEKHPTKPWPFPKPDPAQTDVDQIEINFAEFDDHPINKDATPDFEYYKEDWIVQHRGLLAEMDPRCKEPWIGHMALEPRTNVVSVWDGIRWLTFDYYHLQNLLRPKTQSVTMGLHTYEMVVK
jgi:hypothetical protein